MVIQKKNKFTPAGIFTGEVNCGSVVEGQLNSALWKEYQMRDWIADVIQHALPSEIQRDGLPFVWTGAESKMITRDAATHHGESFTQKARTVYTLYSLSI